MAAPHEYGVDDPNAVAGLREELEQMSLEQLHAKQDDIVSRLGQMPAKREELDKRVEQARMAIDGERLLTALHGKDSNDVAAKEQILDAAVAERQRLRIEVARLEFVAKQVGDQINYINANRIYRASTYAAPAWKDEFKDGVEDIRQDLARLLGLYARLNGIPHTSGIKLDSFVMDILDTHNGFISKGASKQHQQLVTEALALFEKEGEAIMDHEDAKQLGREQVAENYAAFKEGRERVKKGKR